MAISFIQSIKDKLGHSQSAEELSPVLKQRISDVSELFPEAKSISPAVNINPDWCFHIELDNGDRFLAWLHTDKLSGFIDEDGAAPFEDCDPGKSFRHPNVLKPVMIDKVGKHTIVVTEDFRGISLLERIDKDSKFDHNQALKVFHDVASTIRMAHEANVQHRAICSANILIDDDLNVRIFGLGLSNMFFEQWTELLRNKKRRIADYIAPELENDGLVKSVAHCDGYSIARVTYELLTGQLPKSNFVLLPSKICKVPAYMDDALLNAMHSEPEKRPKTITELHQHFFGKHAKQALDDANRDRLSATETISNIYNRYFKWMDTDWFRVVLVLVIFSLVFLGIHLYERYRLDPLEVALQPGMLSVEEINAILKEAEAHGVVHNHPTTVVVKPPPVTVRNSVPAPKMYQPEVVTIKQRPNPRVRQKVQFVEAPTPRIAPNFRLQQDGPVRIMEPTQLERLAKALEDLKKKNPAQTEWHYHLLATTERTILDLSGHANLKDISALHGQTIHELDLSFTSVEKLYDLIGMPLYELRIDQTKVTDLESIVGLPLGVLTFVDTPVTDISATKKMPWLRSILGNDANGPVNEVKPPLPDQKTWINDQGLKFRNLPGIAVMMAVHEFTEKGSTDLMTSISYKKAVNLCSHLTIRERRSGKISGTHRYRLPTDGEWSYAALLPESRFLSPKGRLLQRVEQDDFERSEEEHILLEIREGNPDYERARNGFWGLTNNVGEWVDHNHGNWDGSNLIRGLFVGSDLADLRTRSEEGIETASAKIGFRPVLEIDPDKFTFPSYDGTDPQQLSNRIPENWVAPHLKAAARSSYILNSLLTKPSYRDSFIKNSYKERDPFENKFYLRIDVPMTWSKAKAVASQLGGRLATASSSGQLEWINQQFIETNSLGTPLWMGASASPYKVDWNWTTGDQVPQKIQPGRIDSDKRRGALLASGKQGQSPMTATPVSEKHAFLIEWD